MGRPYLLDTNTCIRYLNGRAPVISVRMKAIEPTQVRVCSVVKAEMFAGSLRSTDPARNLARQTAFFDAFVSLPFDDVAAEHFARIRAALLVAGRPIGPLDTCIAAIACSTGSTLVTHNTAEFSRVDGLSLEDWEL